MMNKLKIGLAALTTTMMMACHSEPASAPSESEVDNGYDQSCGDGRGLDMMVDEKDVLTVILMDQSQIVAAISVQGEKNDIQKEKGVPVDTMQLRSDMDAGPFAAAAATFCAKPTSDSSALKVGTTIAEKMRGNGYDVIIGVPTL